MLDLVVETFITFQGLRDLAATLAVNLDEQRVNDDYVRHPLLVRQHIRRIYGKGFCYHPVPGGGSQFIQLGHGDQDIHDPTRQQRHDKRCNSLRREK